MYICTIFWFEIQKPGFFKEPFERTSVQYIMPSPYLLIL